MKKGHFLWSAHRITEKQKAGKARNIKGKRQSKNFSTVSKQLVALRSSASDNFRDQVAERKAIEPDCKAQVDYDYVNALEYGLSPF